MEEKPEARQAAEGDAGQAGLWVSVYVRDVHFGFGEVLRICGLGPMR